MAAGTLDFFQRLSARLKSASVRSGGLSRLIGLSVSIFAVACSVNSAKKHYLLAEKLWTDGKYAAAVGEFDRASELDPLGKIGLQALFRSGTTQNLFLKDYEGALKKFERYIAHSHDMNASWEAEKLIGDLLYGRLERHRAAIGHYEKLIRQRSDAVEVPDFLLRIGKSAFFMKDFKKAAEIYQQVLRQFPSSVYSEKALFELGVTYFTRGDERVNGKESFQEALDTYQNFLKRHPNSPLAVEAKFGVASCLEEMDQIDAALKGFEALRGHYPAPKVIEIKIARLQERKQQRNR